MPTKMAPDGRASTENRRTAAICNQQLAISNQQSKIPNQQSAISNQQSNESLRVFLRAVTFSSRPTHADQLHLDLWWRGLNVALDAGTYLYNNPSPWDNGLASTSVHNTVMVNDQEQMTRAGRFLWLDWAQAAVTAREGNPNGSLHRITARHNGYRRLGVVHQRSLDLAEDDCLLVKDELLSARQSASTMNFTARLHWLLPDWPWSLAGDCLDLESPYGQKVPALALIAISAGKLPITFTSSWQFPK